MTRRRIAPAEDPRQKAVGQWPARAAPSPLPARSAGPESIRLGFFLSGLQGGASSRRAHRSISEACCRRCPVASPIRVKRAEMRLCKMAGFVWVGAEDVGEFHARRTQAQPWARGRRANTWLVQAGQKCRELGLAARSSFGKDCAELRSDGFPADGQSGARRPDALAGGQAAGQPRFGCR